MAITINSSSSTVYSTYQYTRIQVRSNAVSVRYELYKYPTSNNDSTNYIVFEDTSTTVSTSLTAYFTLYLSGTYVIKITEKNDVPKFYYIEAESLSNNQILPYIGERSNVNSEGWGLKFLNTMHQLESCIGNSISTCAVAADDTLNVGSSGTPPDVILRTGIYDMSQNNIIYSGEDSSALDGIFLLPIEKYTISNDNLFSSGMPLDGKAIFKCLYKGSVVIDYDCGLSVDASDRFFYKESTQALTTDSADTYIGTWTWDSVKSLGVLTIDNAVVIIS